MTSTSTPRRLGAEAPLESAEGVPEPPGAIDLAVGKLPYYMCSLIQPPYKPPYK
jgi:hypothetical protein